MPKDSRPVPGPPRRRSAARALSLSALPAPAGDALRAARTWLTSRYATGVDRVLWETSERPMDDTLAIRTVISAVRAGSQADALDVGAALIAFCELCQGIDRLEAGLLEAARQVDMDWAAIGAIMGISPAEAEQRYHSLRPGRTLTEAGAGSDDDRGDGLL
jgi:hypothetical protein